jgi:molecular chaperone GrpE
MAKDKNIKNDQEHAEETVNQQENNAEENTEETEEKEQKEQDPIEELNQKYNELNDKYLRLYSDFDNFRKRTIKEKGDLISSASRDILKDLLPVLDDFERAMENNENAEDPASIKEGFTLIYNKFKNTLTQKGLKPMESKGEKFDLDLHEAITNVPAQDEEDKGKVIDVIEKGYFLNDKVLRYAKVVVGQ